MTLKLEVGKKYRNRDGYVVQIVKIYSDGIGMDEYGLHYCETGLFNGVSESRQDLIEEVIEPAQEPVKKLIKWAKEAHAWIDGVEVEWESNLGGAWYRATPANNPVTSPHFNWRIAVPKWRKDLADEIDGAVLKLVADNHFTEAQAVEESQTMLRQQQSELESMQERMIVAEKELNHMRSFFGCDPAYYGFTPAKPVAWMPIQSKHTRIQETKPDDEQNWIPLYLRPAKPLTDEEIDDALSAAFNRGAMFGYAEGLKKASEK